MRLYALLNREFQMYECCCSFFFLHSSPFISKYFFPLPYDWIKPEFSINLEGKSSRDVSKYLSLFREVAYRRSAINLINGRQSRTCGVSIANTMIRRHGWFCLSGEKSIRTKLEFMFPQSKRCTGSPKSEVTRPLPIRQVIIRLVNNGQCAFTNSSHICLTRI